LKKILFTSVLMTVLAVILAGCAPGSVAQINTPVPNPPGSPAASSGQINVPGVSIQVNAPGPNPLAKTPDGRGRVAGIWMGIWHGIISPVTLIVSFFHPAVQIYEVHNDGSQYNLGFLLGVAILFVLLGLMAGSRR
jgi:hypothetical protein